MSWGTDGNNEEVDEQVGCTGDCLRCLWIDLSRWYCAVCSIASILRFLFLLFLYAWLVEELSDMKLSPLENKLEEDFETLWFKNSFCLLARSICVVGVAFVLF